MSYSLSEEKKRAHKLSLDSRSALEICGVEEVLGFDERFIAVMTPLGKVEIEGREMKIVTMSAESGELTVIGEIDGVYYAAAPKKGILRKK